MSQKETLNGTVKSHHFDMLVSFECRDDLVQLRNGFRTENVERRVVKRDSPVRATSQTYLLVFVAVYARHPSTRAHCPTDSCHTMIQNMQSTRRRCIRAVRDSCAPRSPRSLTYI